MRNLDKTVAATLSGLLLLALSACGSEVGSDKWCADLKAKPKGDWSTNEAVDYAKHCLLK